MENYTMIERKTQGNCQSAPQLLQSRIETGFSVEAQQLVTPARLRQGK
jgi:hypothetical protein